MIEMHKDCIIVDLESKRYLAEKGWVTVKEYARKFTKDEVHTKLEKLRKMHFLKVTFEELEMPREDKRAQQRKNTVEIAVKQSIKEINSVLQTVQNAQNRLANKL